MAELSTLFKGLRRVAPEVHAELEAATDSNLLRSHPGLYDSNVAFYGGKITKYMDDMTKSDSSQYAIAMMDADELEKFVGKVNIDDPVQKSKVLDLYNRATSSPDGLKSVIKLDGMVSEKGYIDVTKVTPGSQETLAALRLLDRDRPEGVPAARIPVLVNASGAKWASDPAPRLRYNGQTSGTLSMPKWDSRRPPPLTKAVADGTSPTFYLDQPQSMHAAKAKLNVFYDPRASLVHGEAATNLKGFDPLDDYKNRISNPQRSITANEIKEAEDFRTARRERIKEWLDPAVEQFGPGELKRLAGADNMYKMSLLGAKGDEADLPIVWTRTERFGVKPYDKNQFSPALHESREVGMHAGEPNSIRAFQGNPAYHDYQLAQKDLKKFPAGHPGRAEAERAVQVFESKKTSFINMLEAAIPGGSEKANQDLLWDAISDAKRRYASTLKPGDKTAFAQGGERARAMLTESLQERLPTNYNKLNGLSRALGDLAGLFDDMGTTTRPFILKNAKKPLFLVDVGGFENGNVLSQLARMPEFEEKAEKLIQESFGANKGMDKKIQQLIESRGYDHVVYLNSTSEGSELSRYANTEKVGGVRRPVGHTPSIMVWREDQIVPLDELPGAGDKRLKKALGFLVAPAAATQSNNDKSN